MCLGLNNKTKWQNFRTDHHWICRFDSAHGNMYQIQVGSGRVHSPPLFIYCTNWMNYFVRITFCCSDIAGFFILFFFGTGPQHPFTFALMLVHLNQILFLRWAYDDVCQWHVTGLSFLLVTLKPGLFWIIKKCEGKCLSTIFHRDNTQWNYYSQFFIW